MEYSESLTENSCFLDAQCCLLRLIFFWKCWCLLPLLQVALLPPYHQSPSVAQVGAASVPAELSFLPAESWFVWLTDGAPALVRMRLVKGFLFKGRRWSPTPHRPLLTKFPSWSRKAVRKFLIDIVCSYEGIVWVSLERVYFIFLWNVKLSIHWIIQCAPFWTVEISIIGVYLFISGHIKIPLKATIPQTHVTI